MDHLSIISMEERLCVYMYIGDYISMSMDIV